MAYEDMILAINPVRGYEGKVDGVGILKLLSNIVSFFHGTIKDSRSRFSGL